MVGKGFAKGFGERQGRSSLASHLRFACEIGAVLGVFSHYTTLVIAVILEESLCSYSTNLTYTKRYKGPKASKNIYHSDVPFYLCFKHVKRLLD
jgi:hypothetical protein